MSTFVPALNAAKRSSSESLGLPFCACVAAVLETGFEIAGDAVRVCEEKNCELWDLTDEDFAHISEHLVPAVREVLTVEGSLNSRSSQGGTAPSAVAHQLQSLKTALEADREFAARPQRIS